MCQKTRKIKKEPFLIAEKQYKVVKLSTFECCCGLTDKQLATYGTIKTWVQNQCESDLMFCKE